MKLDRTLQREILERLRDHYPESLEVERLPRSDGVHFAANLFYLEERGLIQGSHQAEAGSPFVLARITADGLDFLEGDGGVAAIRGRD
ncbi:MAG: hypothetical protein GF331_14790 [Chitinivibrionales bacterium]|nr:hypothetical protein [Chitinivibrionales bacterium]